MMPPALLMVAAPVPPSMAMLCAPVVLKPQLPLPLSTVMPLASVRLLLMLKNPLVVRLLPRVKVVPAMLVMV